MANSYSYMDEDEIDDELKCVICRQPFREPVSSIQCHHTFCKECINGWLNQDRRCPVCRIHSDYGLYQPIESRPLLNQLNRLRVRCDACQVRNIQRGNFQGHKQKCPNWVIPCIAADIRCAWQGMRNQLDNHVKICPFQQIRPIVDDFYGQINNLQGQINNFQGQIQSHNQQIRDLQGETQGQSRQINNLEETPKFFIIVISVVVILLLSMLVQSRQSRSFGEKVRGLFEN